MSFMKKIAAVATATVLTSSAAFAVTLDFTKDGVREAKAELIPHLTSQQVLERNLRVMDAAAISLCRENEIPIIVFKLMEAANIRRVVCGERIGSVVSTRLEDL